MKNLYLSLPVGQSVRDFLLLGTAERLLENLPRHRLILLSPSYNVTKFVRLCPRDERVAIRRMELPRGTANQRLIRWRLKLRGRGSIKTALYLESRKVTLPPYLKQVFEEFPPDLIVSTHPKTIYEYDIVMWGRRLGVQTAGVVKSWDNIGKGLSSPPHLLSVWNPVNCREAEGLLQYRRTEIQINGSPSFDPYYQPSFQMSRREGLERLGLDPKRPLITLATGGVMDREFYGRDETFLADDLLRMIGSSPVLKSCQLVIRLHGNSRLEHFWRFGGMPDVKISFSSYLPGTMWCPSRDDLIDQVNLLRHSDVIVTPASSWALESAIMDTPTVVPVYSSLQPDHAAAQLDRWTLVKHFKPLVENRWVPVTRSYEETCRAIEEALRHPEKEAAGRQAIVDRYVYFRDAGSSRRVADWIASLASRDSAKPAGF